jgi:aspartyl-tRNA(Asn)/glutamyl-tRNA(Gln) amidotransferase subunit B
LEVVTDPVLSSGEEAMRLFRALRTLVVSLGVCDGNLQEGSMRADANVSVRRPGAPLGTRVELKNINSPRYLMEAVEHEARRQRALLLAGSVVVQETRLWDADAANSRVMRTKEDAPDYRFFADPDLPPILVSEALLASVKAAMPELPWARRARYQEVLGLPPATVAVLVDDDPALAGYFEAGLQAGAPARALANWITNELLGLPGGVLAVDAGKLATLVCRVEEGAVAGRAAKELLRLLADDANADVDGLIDARGLRLQRGSDAEAALKALVAAVLRDNPAQVAQVKAGKDKIKGFLVGQVLKRGGGQVDPKLAQRLVDDALASS